MNSPKLFTGLSKNLKTAFKNLFVIGFVCALASGCGVSKTQKACMEFDKGYIESCNKSCPSECEKEATRVNKNNYTVAQIKQVCKEACVKHCQILLAAQRPKQCNHK
jgi:hypothetical protein